MGHSKGDTAKVGVHKASVHSLHHRWVLIKERNYLHAERMLYRAQGREMPAVGRLKCVRVLFFLGGCWGCCYIHLV